MQCSEETTQPAHARIFGVDIFNIRLENGVSKKWFLVPAGEFTWKTWEQYGSNGMQNYRMFNRPTNIQIKTTVVV